MKQVQSQQNLQTPNHINQDGIVNPQPGEVTAPQESQAEGISPLVEILRRAIRSLEKADLRFSNSLTRLQDLEKRMEEGRFHLAVLGQFKRGKSTLLNALLGEALVPSAVVPLTSIPTFVRYRKMKHVNVTFMDGHTQAIHPEGIADFVTEEKNPHNRMKVKHVEIGHPAPLLSRGIVLIDTPGIGSTFKHNSLATLEFLPHCDAALFLVSADPPMTETEVEFLRAIRAQVDRIFFVLNKVDYLSTREQEQAVGFFHRVLREQIGMEDEITLFSLSARRGLEAKLEENRALWRTSGMQDLETRLIEFALKEKTGVLQQVIARRALQVGSGIILQIDLERRSLELPLQDLDQRIDVFNSKLQEIEQQRRAASDLLAGDQRRTAQFIEDRSNEVCEKALAQMKPWMSQFFSEAGLAMTAQQMETKFHEEMERSLPEIFDAEGGLFFADLRGRVQQALEMHLGRSAELFEAVHKTAAEIFEIQHHPVNLAAALPHLKDPYWETTLWSGAVGTPSAQSLEKLMPRKMKRRKAEARLRDEVDRLVGQNVESLRWNVLRQTDDAFRNLTREMDRSFVELIEGTKKALEAARKGRLENAESFQQLLQELIRFRQTIQDWTHQLESTLA